MSPCRKGRWFTAAPVSGDSHRASRSKPNQALIPHSVREGYSRYGVKSYYTLFGSLYRNPHAMTIQEILEYAFQHWPLDYSAVLDLACGSGEVTQILRRLTRAKVEGIDPYTDTAYKRHTGKRAENLTFEQIAQGALAERSYSLIVCSYALHLVDVSWLPMLIYQLSVISSTLLIITPHKRPQIRREWGWILVNEVIIDRVRARLYVTDRQSKS